MGYRRWDDSYWQSGCRERIGRDHIAANVWHWLVCSAHSNSLGVYRIPWRVAWVELWLESEAAGREAVARCVELVGPGSARLSGDWIWLVGASMRQHDPITSPKDNRCKSRAFLAELETVRSSPFASEWYARNEVHFRLSTFTPFGPPSDPLRTPFGPPSKGSPNPFGPPSEGSLTPFEGVALPIPSHPIPTQPSPAQPNAGGLSFRVESDPWPAQASAPALDAYMAELHKTAMEPQGDVVEPFERAAIYLRDRMGRDPSTIPATLSAIVALAAKTPEFRKHPKHGDLFLRPSAVMGRRIGSPDNLGVDVKIPEWLNRLAAEKPRPVHRPQVLARETFVPPTDEEKAEIAKLMADTAAMLKAKRSSHVSHAGGAT